MLLPLHSYSIATASSSRLVNCYAEAAPPDAGGKGPLVMHRTPGIRTVAALGSGAGRGMHIMAGQLYSVSGTELFRGLLGPSIGTVPGSDKLFMTDNGIQLAIVTGSNGYVYSGGLARITDPDFIPGPCDFIDQFLVLAEPGSGRFRASDISDFSNYDALQFATTEVAPDNLVSLIVDHEQIVLFGELTTELWQNAGTSGFPFARIPNGVIEMGCAGEHAVCKQDQSVFWLANDRTLRRLEGNTPKRASQHGAERKWRTYATVSDCELTPYTLDGHLCVVLRFPSANATWVYDCTTQEIHEREGRRFMLWDVSDIATTASGTVYVQRASTGEIGVLDPLCYSQWGETMRAEWTYQNIYGQGKRMSFDRLEMGLETGVGDNTSALPDEVSPEITLEASNDGGKTFPLRFATRSIGEQGKYRQRVHWDRMGSGFDRVYRGSFSANRPLTIWDTQAT